MSLFKWPSAKANYGLQNTIQTIACFGKSNTLCVYSRLAKPNTQLGAFPAVRKGQKTHQKTWLLSTMTIPVNAI